MQRQNVLIIRTKNKRIPTRRLFRNRPRLPKINDRHPGITKRQLLLTRIVNGIEILHLHAPNIFSSLTALRAKTTRKDKFQSILVCGADGRLGELGVPVRVRAHMADGEIQDAF